MNPKNYSRSGINVARVRELLADGAWKPLSEIVAVLSLEVTPESAMRRSERHGRKYKNLPAATRRLVKERLDAMIRTLNPPALERKEADGDYYYRLNRT